MLDINECLKGALNVKTCLKVQLEHLLHSHTHAALIAYQEKFTIKIPTYF